LRGIGRERRGAEVEREERESDGGRAQKEMERRGKGRGDARRECGRGWHNSGGVRPGLTGKWNADLQALA
jgi:hypothetical protein